MIDILDVGERLNVFGLISGIKKGCIFVSLLFIFFLVVEYWVFLGCELVINVEFRSGKSVFSLWYLDSEGNCLRLLVGSCCMLVIVDLRFIIGVIYSNR